MKKAATLALIAVVALAVVSCAKNKPSDVFGKLQSIGDVNDMNALKKFYTKDTVKALEELLTLMPKEMQSTKDANKFPKEAKWEVLSEKVEGDTAEVKVKFINHPMANLKGTEAVFKMKKEEGDWKIDQETEIKQAVTLFKGLGGKDGMLKELKKMMK